MAAIIGIDIGYGFTKSYYSQGSSGSEDSYCFDIFPTAMSKFIPKITFSDSRSIIKVNEDQFLVGETALREGVGLINTRQSDFVGSTAYCAILNFALLRNIRNPYMLILGLPPGQYSRPYSDMITHNIKSSKIHLPDRMLVNIPEIIRFIPQGAGIFFSYLRHGGSDAFNQRVAIIDVGFYTLDMLFMIKGRYIENSAQSHQLGVSRLYDQVRKEFQNKFRISLRNHKTIDQILTTGKVTIMGKPYELDAKQILESYNAEVSSNVANFVENLSDEVDIIVCGGGGVRFLKTDAFRYNLSITEHPQFANARGYFEYGKHVMARG